MSKVAVEGILVTEDEAQDDLLREAAEVGGSREAEAGATKVYAHVCISMNHCLAYNRSSLGLTACVHLRWHVCSLRGTCHAVQARGICMHAAYTLCFCHAFAVWHAELCTLACIHMDHHQNEPLVLPAPASMMVKHVKSIAICSQAHQLAARLSQAQQPTLLPLSQCILPSTMQSSWQQCCRRYLQTCRCSALNAQSCRRRLPSTRANFTILLCCKFGSVSDTLL